MKQTRVTVGDKVQTRPPHGSEYKPGWSLYKKERNKAMDCANICCHKNTIFKL